METYLKEVKTFLANNPGPNLNFNHPLCDYFYITLPNTSTILIHPDINTLYWGDINTIKFVNLKPDMNAMPDINTNYWCNRHIMYYPTFDYDMNEIPEFNINPPPYPYENPPYSFKKNPLVKSHMIIRGILFKGEISIDDNGVIRVVKKSASCSK